MTDGVDRRDGGARRGARARRAFGLAAVLLTAVLASACVGPGRRDVASWLEARGADLMDVAGVRVSVGAGLGAYVRLTEYAQLGFLSRGLYDLRSVQVAVLEGERDASLRGVPCLVVGNHGRYGGLWSEATREVYLPAFARRDVYRVVHGGVVSEDGRDDPWRHSFGAGLHVLLAGAEVEVRPHEALDLLGGLVGFDPAGDDVPLADEEAPEGDADAR